MLILGLFLFALLDTFVFSNYQLTDAQLAGILRSPRTWTGVGVSLMLLLVLAIAASWRAAFPRASR